MQTDDTPKTFARTHSNISATTKEELIRQKGSWMLIHPMESFPMQGNTSVIDLQPSATFWNHIWIKLPSGNKNTQKMANRISISVIERYPHFPHLCVNLKMQMRSDENWGESSVTLLHCRYISVTLSYDCVTNFYIYI